MEYKDILKLIPRQEQDQRSLTEQLRDLQAFANQLGMYDAADFIQSLVESVNRKVKP